jgi:hypothetical protein
VYGTGLKNIMERFIRQTKDRTECFDDHFPCRKENCDRKQYLKLVEVICTVLAYGKGQDTVYEILG